MRTLRESRSLLAVAERRLIDSILPLIPNRISSDHLTYLGFAGAIVTGISLALLHFAPYLLSVALIGLFINWFGDSFDGSLARYRNVERPRYGFLIDHSLDLVSTTFILIGLGLSPYLPFGSACFALIIYLLFCGFVYVKVAADGVHRLDFCSIGATEFRLFIACWVLVVDRFDLRDIVNSSLSNGGTVRNVHWLDVIVAAMSVIACLGLVRVIFHEAAKLSRVEPVPFDPETVVEILKVERRMA